ncbi:MAG: methyl-accepting chemotaxis protein [Clostridiales bacterium]|nr:methyl-accepting chemotaxis protein [Clostridiales bacterium]
MKLLRKLLIRIILLIILTSISIGGLALIKSYTSTNDLMMSKVTDQLSLRTALVEEKMISTVRLIETLSLDKKVMNSLKTKTENADLKATFTTTLENYSDLITLIALIDEEGTVLFSDSKNDIKNIDVSERDYLKDAISSKETVISEVILSKADNSQSIAICKPIYDNGKYIGSIVSTVKFTLITDLIKETKIAEKGYAYMVDIKGDNAGLVVQHVNPDMIMKKNLYEYDIPELTDLVDQMKTVETGEGYYTFDGEKKYVKYQQFENWAIAITANQSDLNATALSIRNMVIVTILVAIVIASLVGYIVINRLIIKPIGILERSMSKAGEGDLTHHVEIRTKDEIQQLGESYNMMLDNQKEILNRIIYISQDLSASAEELTASAEEVNGSADEVSENINGMMENILSENTAISSVEGEMEKLNEFVETSNMLTKKSQIACIETLETANEGRLGVESSILSITNISNATDELMDAFEVLNTHAKKVTGISETIKSIAEQINLLALNASIEAARAGDAGRGFTVVAEEVRKLAEQTTQESANVYNVLNTIIKLITEANKNADSAKINVDKGEATIQSLDGKFLSIIEGFENINSHISELNDISSSQVVISDDINKSIVDISGKSSSNTSMAQEISASAEEQAAITESLSQASEETSAMADELTNLVARFTIE